MSDGDDDPQLRSLRAIWLSLPDGEPSQTGMAQLIAAARVQVRDGASQRTLASGAEHMARPSLWHRALETLRRPAVLSLATIIVLIGGVVFVGQRRDQLEAEKAAAAGTSRQERPGATSQAPGLNAGIGSAVSTVAEQQTKPDKAEESQVAPPVTTSGEPPRLTPRPRPADTNPRVGRADDATVPMAPSVGGGRAGIKVGGPTTADPVASKDSARDKDDRATLDQRRPKVTNTIKIAEDGPVAEPSATAEPRDRKDPANQPAITQLLAQCRSAATRGDCAAVRLIAQRIAKQNAGFYRDRVANDITITKCLAAE